MDDAVIEKNKQQTLCESVSSNQCPTAAAN